MTKEKIIKATNEFNKYHGKEAKTKLVSFNKSSFEIEFFGPFCKSCGFYDYFDDFEILLKDAGLKTKTLKIKETDNGGIVKYKKIK